MLRFEHERMSQRIRSSAECARNAPESVAIDAVCSHVRHEFRGRVPIGGAHVARTLIPSHEREDDFDSAAMKIRNHLLDPSDATGHGANHVVLIAVVDADVRIHWPDQNGIDATVALPQVVQIFIDGVVSRVGVVEVAVLDHHLGLDETGLSPLEFGPLVFLLRIAGANPCLHAPMGDVVQPGFVVVRGAGLLLPRGRLNRREAIRSGNLISIGRVMGGLCRCACQEE